MSPRYARIRLDGRTIYLRLSGEDDRFIEGYEIDRTGDEIVPRGNQYDRRLRIIEKARLSRRTPMTMDRHYGELVEETA